METQVLSHYRSTITILTCPDISRSFVPGMVAKTYPYHEYHVLEEAGTMPNMEKEKD